MIQTYKIKHGRDFSKELVLARKIADFSINNKNISSANVKHIGLKSMISNQIIRKYSRSKTVKEIKSVKLTIPNQGIKILDNKINIPCLELKLDIYFNKNFEKINQIEIGEEYAYISASYKDAEPIKIINTLGVDRNSTHHVIVASCIETGKILKLGKSCNHIHNKYSRLRRKFQKQGKYGLVKKIKQRESNIIKDINHKTTTKLVKHARTIQSNIVLENLKNIRQTAKSNKGGKYTLNSWSFYQQQMFLDYKSKKYGVNISYIEPQYTSQRCSKCGHIERANRLGNLFSCVKCKTVEDSGVNAGFNIAYLHKFGIFQFNKERDLLKGNTDIPKRATI